MKILKLGLVTAGLMLLPATAYAVNVSSNDGSGTQGVSFWLSDNRGAQMTGSLRSTHGNPVYYSGLAVYDNAPDDTVGRYTSNTSSTTSVSRGGTISADIPGVDGVAARVCRDRAGVPDPCGSWSTTMHK